MTAARKRNARRAPGAVVESAQQASRQDNAARTPAQACEQILLDAGIPPLLVTLYMEWRRQFPDRHIGPASSRWLAAMIHEHRTT